MCLGDDVSIGALKLVFVVHDSIGAAHVLSGIDGLHASAVHVAESEGPRDVTEVVLAWAADGAAIDLDGMARGDARDRVSRRGAAALGPRPSARDRHALLLRAPPAGPHASAVRRPLVERCTRPSPAGTTRRSGATCRTS